MDFQNIELYRVRFKLQVGERTPWDWQVFDTELPAEVREKLVSGCIEPCKKIFRRGAEIICTSFSGDIYIHLFADVEFVEVHRCAK